MALMPRGGQAAARIRAAHAYSDLSREELAAAVGVSPRQLGRLEAGQATADRPLCDRIADATGVPRLFLLIGFAPMMEPISDADERLYLMEQKIAALDAAIQPERLVEIFRPVLEEAGPGEPRVPSAPRTSRRAKGRRPAAEGDGGA